MGMRVAPQCFLGHLVLDALYSKAPQSLHFTWWRKREGSKRPLKCQGNCQAHECEATLREWHMGGGQGTSYLVSDVPA